MTHEPSAPVSNDPELDVTPPIGVELDYPLSGGVRVRVSIPLIRRLLLTLPRVLLVLGVVTVVIESWRHHLFVAFWFFGLPFLRWLRGPKQRSLSIGERSLDVEGANWFGGTRSLPRAGIERISFGRAGLLQLFQSALLIEDKDAQITPLFVGLSPAQAEFLNAGLQRWLTEDG